MFEDIVPGIMAGMKVCAVADEYSRHQEQEKKKLSDYFIINYYDIMENL